MKSPSLSSRVGKAFALWSFVSPIAAWSQTTLPPQVPASPPASPATPVPCGGNPDQYMAGIAEEFDIPLNPNIWLDRFSYTVPNQPPSGYEISNGTLKIWLERDETDPDRSFQPRVIYSDPVTPMGGDPRRTGYVQRYGCFEIEAKLPFGKGPFPAFWLEAVTKLPEIDIMETYLRDQYADSQRHPISYEVTAHIPCTPDIPNCSADRHALAVDPKLTYTNEDLSAGFHRYGALWEPNRITFYYDGHVVHTIELSLSDPMFIGIGMLPDPRSEPDDTTPTRRGNTLDPGAAYEVNYMRTWCFKSFGCN